MPTRNSGTFFNPTFSGVSIKIIGGDGFQGLKKKTPDSTIDRSGVLMKFYGCAVLLKSSAL
jgi:hypothetical protein